MTEEWHEECFYQGYKARQHGFDIISQNPYDIGLWGWKSFRAGWCDADADPECPKDEIH